MKTFTPKPKDLTHNWYIIDATDVVLGRLASVIADTLRGKSKPTYAPNADSGDFVIVINAEKVAVTGRKENEKPVYTYHLSGKPGALRSTTYAQLRVKNPDRMIRNTVKGMLPKNRLSAVQLSRLRVFAGADYPYKAQKPVALSADKKINQQAK